MVKSGRWEGSSRLRGLLEDGGGFERPSPSGLVDVSGGGGGISEMAFRMEVRSFRGVGREDDGADIFA